MTAHAAIAASPKAGTPNRALMQAMLVSRVAYILASGEDPQAFDPRGEDGSPLTQVIGYNGLWFWLDEADSTTGHDGTTCIVTTATGGRYKVTNVDLLITSVKSKTVDEAPDPDDVDEEARPSNGDAYIVPAAATGADWATHEGDIAVWVEARREWFYIAPKPGWFVSIPGDTRDFVYRYDSVQADWIMGDGSTPALSTIPLSALIGFGLGPVRVQNQTTYAPPGSRQTNGTPTSPLGGTASNINDNSDSTSATSGSIGNKSGASIADRIAARISYPAAVDLIAIECRGLLGSVASSSNAMGLYYSTDNGSNWTQAGSGFTLSTSAQTILRTGTFDDVTDIALVTEAKNWGSNSHTVGGLNGFDATVDVAVGDAYIIGPTAIGVLAGHEGKVAICEVADTLTVYTPQSGNRVFDISLGTEIRWNGTAWVSPTAIVDYKTTGILVAAAQDAVGSTIYSYNNGTGPTTSNLQTVAATLAFAAKKSGAVLEVEFRGSINAVIDGGTLGSSVSDRGVVAALFRDSETNAIDWFKANVSGATPEGPMSLKFLVTTSDDDEHTYTVGLLFYVTGGTSLKQIAVDRRILSIKEIG